jgi:hypothetical protein
MPVKAEQLTYNLIQLIILIGNDFNSNSELQITIRKKNDVVPCPKRGDMLFPKPVCNTLPLNLFFPTHSVLFPFALL